MKITTRIISGYGLFIALLIGMAAYQVITITRIQSIHNTLRESNFQNSLLCLQVLRDHDLVEEYTRKLFALADPDYVDQIREFQKDYESQLVKLGANAVSAQERIEVKRLQRLWSEFSADFKLQLQNLPPGGTAMPDSLQDGLERLRTQTVTVYQTSLQSMSAEVERSRTTARTAGMILWSSVFAALAVSVLVSFLIYRSISNPLSSLTEGTRAIAEGKFYYRLDTSRRDEFSQLAKDFNTMTRRLRELDDLKKDFVSHVSHELKAPLASMRETIQLLLDEIPGPLTDKQKRLLELNLQSEARLSAMISNLLDLSRMEAGVMEYAIKSQDLVPLVHGAVAEMEVQAREKRIALQLTVPDSRLMALCDENRILQVLVNLVGNAVKFSPRDASVQITAEAVEAPPGGMPNYYRSLVPEPVRGRQYVLVSIADSGSGIPDEEKETVFQKFHQRGQDRKTASQGAGLGLTISRTIVEAHRGALWVEDNPGAGSRFCMLLPPGETRGNHEDKQQFLDAT
jgi:two-component system sensor histidine kinase GlrK